MVLVSVPKDSRPVPDITGHINCPSEYEKGFFYDIEPDMKEC